MPSRRSERDEAAKRAEALRRGLVVLDGGPWRGHWFFGDDYAAEPSGSSRKVGYVVTSERWENPGGWGLGVVYRFDPAAVPAADVAPVPVPLWVAEPRCCGVCGQRLLLGREGRVVCEACRMSG